MKKMNTAIITFLAVAVVILVVSLTVITKWYIDLCDNYDECVKQNGVMVDDYIRLLNDKLEVEKEKLGLYTDNVKLSNAVRELRAINEQLAEINKELTSNKSIEEVNTLLPPSDIPTNTYRCEPYRIWDDETQTYHSAFSKNSDQAALQEDCYTEPETGIRYYLETSTGRRWYCAALAGAYGIEIGHCYIFTLANGTELPVMLADFKHDITDPRPDDYGDDDTNYDGENCLNVIEFVVDLGAMPSSAREAGSMSKLDKFGGLYGHDGNIVDVEDAGRRWKG